MARRGTDQSVRYVTPSDQTDRVTIDSSQVLYNKALQDPTIINPEITGGTLSGVDLGLDTELFFISSGVINANVKTSGTWTHFSASGSGSDASVTLAAGTWIVFIHCILDVIYTTTDPFNFISLSTDAPPSTPTETNLEFTTNYSLQMTSATYDNFSMVYPKVATVSPTTETTYHVIGLPSPVNPTTMRLSVRSRVEAVKIA